MKWNIPRSRQAAISIIRKRTTEIGALVLVMILAGAVLPQTASAAHPNVNVIFILDGSGSMWGDLDNEKKIVIAKERMTELVEELDGVNMGLIVYGHRRKADCNDIEIMVPLQPDNRSKVIEKIQSVSPKGKTEISQYRK